jgi:hypothetical protein
MNLLREILEKVKISLIIEIESLEYTCEFHIYVAIAYKRNIVNTVE